MSRQLTRRLRLVRESLQIVKRALLNRPATDKVDSNGLDHIAANVARLVRSSSEGCILFVASQSGKKRTGFRVTREAGQLYVMETIHLVPSARKITQPSNPLLSLFIFLFFKKRVLSPSAAEPEREQAIRKLFAELNIAPAEDSVRDVMGYTDAARSLRYPIGNDVDRATQIIQRLLREVYHVQEADGLSFTFMDPHKLFPNVGTEHEYKRALALDPNDTDAHIGLGFVYINQQRYGEAEREYKQALALDPDNITALQHLAYIYGEQGRYVEAERECKRVLALAPNDKDAHVGLGNAYAGQQRYTEAEEECKRAITLDPNDKHAHENLAYIYAAQKRKQRRSRNMRKSSP